MCELVLRQSEDKHLVDYNYNIEYVVASGQHHSVGNYIMVLELFLRGSDGKEIERVVLEMNRDEAKAFVGRLDQIEKELVSSS